jgi:hypothetical protein
VGEGVGVGLGVGDGVGEGVGVGVGVARVKVSVHAPTGVEVGEPAAFGRLDGTFGATG